MTSAGSSGNDNKKLLTIAIAFVLIVLLGVFGYSRLLHVSLLDALYMTIITISTVGYKEIADMTPEAKLFFILIIFFGLTFVGYLFTSIVALFVDGSVRDKIQRRRLRSRMESLNNHYIICGAGETGENVIRQFEKSHVAFIVIDNDRERVEELIARNVMALYGNAADEDILLAAGIRQARGLISTLSTDADNVFTVLTSRYLNKDLYIISKAIEDHAHEKLTRAGANRTISPNEIGGRRMAALMLRPTVISFLDMITHVGDVILDLEDVVLEQASPLLGQTLRTAKIPEKTGLIVLAIKKAAGQMIFNPGSDEKLLVGDSMIVLGTDDQINALKQLSHDSGERACP